MKQRDTFILDKCKITVDKKNCLHARVSPVNPVERIPLTTKCKLTFRSAAIWLATPQLPTIQSIPEGRNQIPPSHFRCRFTRIDSQ